MIAPIRIMSLLRDLQTREIVLDIVEKLSSEERETLLKSMTDKRNLSQS
jgi:hypothetical protein